MRFATVFVGMFLLFALAAPAQAHVYTFSINTPFVIPDNSLTVQGFFDLAGMSGRVYKVVVKVRGLSHASPGDLDVTVSALAIHTTLMSDAESGPVSGINLRFDDCATRVPLDGSGGYHPYNRNSGLPDGLIGGTSLSDYTGINPNTTWHVRFTDDTANGVAGAASGVDLVIYTDDENLGQKRSVACETPDFDGDGRMDFAIYRETAGQYFIQESSSGAVVSANIMSPGQPNGDVAIPADYDGDGVTDMGVFRRATTTWVIKRSFIGDTLTVQGGSAADQPIPADIDHDGRTDLAIFRPSTAEWFWLSSVTGQIKGFQAGIPGVDKPARRP